MTDSEKKLLEALTNLLHGEVDSQCNAVELIKELTGITISPSV